MSGPVGGRLHMLTFMGVEHGKAICLNCHELLDVEHLLGGWTCPGAPPRVPPACSLCQHALDVPCVRCEAPCCPACDYCHGCGRLACLPCRDAVRCPHNEHGPRSTTPRAASDVETGLDPC